MNMKTFARQFMVGAVFAWLGLGVAAGENVYLKHVHGLAYSQDGKRLFIPSHDGLAVYNEGHWSKAPGPLHDYMGFTGTSKHFYSSGHPAKGSGLVNPFGLIKSNDGGKTWQKLGLEGESDFHLLAAGFETDAIYVYNTERNSRMRRPGLYRTLNDGFSWQPLKASGLRGELNSIAVHPSAADVVAVGTDAGLYLSQDGGQQFKLVASGQRVMSVFFDLDGRHLWYGTYAGAGRLYRTQIRGGNARQIQLPPLPEDAVAYVAQNPVTRSEFAIATFQRDVYLTRDGGASWKQMARRGETL
jgi:photosystem II stability/assembly factor-like uncharacterized protein